ncbi:MAG: hypothetical protein NWE92_03405 [Candidatus Bathyarchaeota archaeon]|nr:hypothetical protein [Candidatus Bathyarchaeota archaeon]
MAYVRNSKESLEIDYAIELLWKALPTVVKKLEWAIEEKDDTQHKAKLKTKSGFMSYSTVLVVKAESLDENKTKMTINAETPVTTITAMVDVGRTRDRVETFIIELANCMEKKTKSGNKK